MRATSLFFFFSFALSFLAIFLNSIWNMTICIYELITLAWCMYIVHNTHQIWQRSIRSKDYEKWASAALGVGNLQGAGLQARSKCMVGRLASMLAPDQNIEGKNVGMGAQSALSPAPSGRYFRHFSLQVCDVTKPKQQNWNVWWNAETYIKRAMRVYLTKLRRNGTVSIY